MNVRKIIRWEQIWDTAQTISTEAIKIQQDKMQLAINLVRLLEVTYWQKKKCNSVYTQ